MNNLDEKFKLYLSEVTTVQDKYGFIYSEECDSLLFTGLLGSVPGTAVFINAAFDASKGQWNRRPLNLPPCYDCTQDWNLFGRLKLMLQVGWQTKFKDKAALAKIFEKGGSSISRDMLIGLAWYAYVNNRLDISEQVIRYALTHFCLMGQGTPTRTFMTPGLLSTYAWISYRLGGPSRPWLRYLPQMESKSVTDFQAHLSVLHIILRNKLTGKDKYGDLLAFQADRNPENALFQFAAGRVDKAYTILNNERYFPSNRLPRKSDRKGPWLWERDFGDNYQPSDSEKILSGGDFLFVYALCKGLI
jgi:hypothetical protein